jgi:hypothetical protein
VEEIMQDSFAPGTDLSGFMNPAPGGNNFYKPLDYVKWPTPSNPLTMPAAPTPSSGLSASVPELPGMGTAPAGGLGGMQLAAMLSMLGKAFAPKYNAWGHQIGNSWQGGLAEGVQGMSQAQIMAQALAAPSSGAGGQVNPQMLLMLMNNPSLMSVFGGGK